MREKAYGFYAIDIPDFVVTTIITTILATITPLFLGLNSGKTRGPRRVVENSPTQAGLKLGPQSVLVGIEPISPDDT